jgi:uncharacterized protein YndB with AHSA1/START domain
MTFQPDPEIIRWRLHLVAAPEQVYRFLATDEGRACFWAESALERGGVIEFIFPNGQTWAGRILEAAPSRRFSVEYLGSVATFELAEDGAGTDLTLTDAGVQPQDRGEVIAGWVSVLLALKAAIDFGVDLRTHDPDRTWDQGFAEN